MDTDYFNAESQRRRVDQAMRRMREGRTNFVRAFVGGNPDEAPRSRVYLGVTPTWNGSKLNGGTGLRKGGRGRRKWNRMEQNGTLFGRFFQTQRGFFVG